MNKPLKNHIMGCLNKGIRFDGRKLEEYRKIVIEKDVTKTAEGSARVKIGNSEVIVGIKMGIGEPYPDTPDEGTLMVGAELSPLASPEFESGPPDIQSIELARVVDRGIREAKTVDVKKLCIEAGEKVWMVSIDICPINDDGNLLDAAGIAALVALENTKFPKYDGKKLDYKTHTKEKLSLDKLPIPITVLKIGDKLLVDPLPEEEDVFDARLTVTTTEDEKICALQKGGETPLTFEDISKMVDLALKKSVEIRKQIEGK